MEFLIAIYLFLFGTRLLCARELSHREFNRKVDFLQHRAMNVSNHQRATYSKNLAEIKKHNNRFKEGLETYTLKMNQFGDLPKEEFKNMMRSLPYDENKKSMRQHAYFGPQNTTLPTTVDWREQGAVASIKDQGPCGSCYAFGTISAIESQYFIKNKFMIPFSEQQVMDCSPAGSGCIGGYDFKVYEYGRDVGLMAENLYPYETQNGPCRFKNNKVLVKLKGFKRVNLSSVYDLEAAIALHGPASITIKFPYRLQFISGLQVLIGKWCAGVSAPYHSITVVGYDTTKEGLKYWIIRNSWGTKWADKGYFYVERHKDDICGIVQQAYIPELD